MLNQFISNLVPTPSRRILISTSIRGAKGISPSSSFFPFSTSSSCITRKFSSSLQNQQNEQPQGSKTALIIGSSGSLGSTIAKCLKSRHDCVVIGSDIHSPSQDRFGAIDAFIHLSNDMDHDCNDSDITNITNIRSSNSQISSIDLLRNGLDDGIKNLYHESKDIELDAIIVASGGFAMDDDKGDNNMNHANNGLGKVYENMLQMNYYPVIAAGEIAKQYMTQTNDGLFVVIGAVSALSPAPGMNAYSSSKAAAHYYVQTMGAMTGRALHREHKISRESDMGYELRRKHACLDSMTALGILPIMLDTESNRNALPNDDFDQWTKPIDIAKEIGTWIDTPFMRPHSGSLVKALTKDGETQFILAR